MVLATVAVAAAAHVAAPAHLSGRLACSRVDGARLVHIDAVNGGLGGVGERCPQQVTRGCSLRRELQQHRHTQHGQVTAPYIDALVLYLTAQAASMQPALRLFHWIQHPQLDSSMSTKYKQPKSS